jgi:uridine kinase
MDVRIVAVAGGSCSGKTRMARHTYEALGDQVCTIIRQDSYYKDRGNLPAHAPLPNFDHADAFEWELMRNHVLELKAGRAIEVPTYDFATHSRTAKTLRVVPKPIILIEGILLLSQPLLLALIDQAFFVECSESVRLERRLARDVAERGRTPASVRIQFAEQVAPMHALFVEPSKANADMIITQNQCGIEMITHNGPLIAFCKGMLTAMDMKVPRAQENWSNEKIT